MPTPTFLAVDLETTGLDPKSKHIIEVAAVVLDENFEPVCDWYHVRVYCESKYLARMPDEVRAMHLGTGLVYQDGFGDLKVRDATVTMEMVAIKLAAMAAMGESLVLLGCGPHFERKWLRHYAAHCENRLSYRHCDSRTAKILGGDSVLWPERSAGPKHTARGDIEHSIEVLKLSRALMRRELATPYNSIVEALEATFIPGTVSLSSFAVDPIDEDEVEVRIKFKSCVASRYLRAEPVPQPHEDDRPSGVGVPRFEPEDITAPHRDVDAPGGYPTDDPFAMEIAGTWVSDDAPSPDTEAAYTDAVAAGKPSTPVALTDAASKR